MTACAFCTLSSGERDVAAYASIDIETSDEMEDEIGRAFDTSGTVPVCVTHADLLEEAITATK